MPEWILPVLSGFVTVFLVIRLARARARVREVEQRADRAEAKLFTYRSRDAIAAATGWSLSLHTAHPGYRGEAAHEVEGPGYERAALQWHAISGDRAESAPVTFLVPRRTTVTHYTVHGPRGLSAPCSLSSSVSMGADGAIVVTAQIPRDVIES